MRRRAAGGRRMSSGGRLAGSGPRIVLHLGAHRTAVGATQSLLERERATLAASGVAAWTPRRGRRGALARVAGDPGTGGGRLSEEASRRMAGRIALRRAGLAAEGIETLVVSDAGVMGDLRENVLLARLYPSVAPRLHRVAEIMPGIACVALAIRSPDEWWTSAFATLIARGFAPPSAEAVAAVARSDRGWRRVVEDIAAALPGAAITVWDHCELGAGPSRAVRLLTGCRATTAPAPYLNAAPDIVALRARLAADGWPGELPGLGRAYAPFDPDTRAAMRAAHAEDLAWLHAGADGLAQFATTAPGPVRRDRKGPRHGWRPANRLGRPGPG